MFWEPLPVIWVNTFRHHIKCLITSKRFRIFAPSLLPFIAQSHAIQHFKRNDWKRRAFSLQYLMPNRSRRLEKGDKYLNCRSAFSVDRERQTEEDEKSVERRQLPFSKLGSRFAVTAFSFAFRLHKGCTSISSLSVQKQKCIMAQCLMCIHFLYKHIWA